MHIQKFSVLLLSLALLSNVASAQSTTRQQQTERIIAQYLGKPVTPDSPIVQQELAEAKALNPSASDEIWHTVASDLAATLSQEMTGRGSPGFESVAIALKQLSDSEVRRLDELLSDLLTASFRMR